MPLMSYYEYTKSTSALAKRRISFFVWLDFPLQLDFSVWTNIPEASNFYLALSYKFSTQALNRPNFAKILAARADEERDHAHGFAKFQLSRGGDVDIGVIGKSDIAEVDTIAEALEKMIEKEKALTRELLNLNKLAENGNCASDSW